jgi:iron complex transport system ATP-binding protein
VALVPQRSEVAAGFTVRQVVAMGRAPHQGAFLRQRREDVEACEDAIESCDLKDLADRFVDTLSGGEHQRVHIARAIASQAPVLLLDEPGAHLDVRHSQAIYRLLAEQVAERELACAAVMHDLGAAARHADRILLMEAGRTVADGTPDAVMTSTQLSTTFGTPLRVGRDAGQPYVIPQVSA